MHHLRDIETFFKTAKSGAALNDIPAGTRHGVEVFVRAALLRATLAMKVKARFVRLVPAMHRLRINPQQWMRWWNRQLPRLLHELIPGDDELGLAELMTLLSDPNKARTPSRHAFGGLW